MVQNGVVGSNFWVNGDPLPTFPLAEFAYLFAVRSQARQVRRQEGEEGPAPACLPRCCVP